MKILIAEDDMATRRKLEASLLSWNYEVVVARDGDEALLALQGEDAPRLAILDWMMPGKDGLKVCEEVRNTKAEPYVYILLLTARDRKDDVVQGLEAGADDYLTKPYDAHELRARLRTGRRILALQEALLSARDALRFQATLDPLTGLWNRTAMLAALKRELARAERQSASLSVIMVDLDHFSRVNETHGHFTGDSVLRDTAQRIQSVSRIIDSVGRYGGEEFIIISPEYDPSKASGQAERIRAAIGDEALDISEGIIQLTASVGVVTSGNTKEANPTALLDAATLALSRAKALGGNRVEMARTDDVHVIASAKRQGENARRQVPIKHSFVA
ncbi:MAG: diguanylate cyclase [Terriglobia bacterium]